MKIQPILSQKCPRKTRDKRERVFRVAYETAQPRTARGSARRELAENCFSNSPTGTVQNPQISFRSSYFEDFNNKYSTVRSLLQKETDEFILTGMNATKLGEGIGGETFKFNHPRLANIVIKRNKSGYTDDYAKEYKNLAAVPTEIIGGQEAVARVNNIGDHYLISTLVPGKCVSRENRYTEQHLVDLFNKMFELDKLGIYHGDLNGKNILLSSNGTVNFIDYQWTEKIAKMNFFDNEKSQKCLLPLSEFPENAQMFEMASMPWYMDSFDTVAEKEKFLKTYLKVKSNYHAKRYDYIKKITRNWPYSGELARIQQALQAENAKAIIYRNPDSDVLKLEMKKVQFLSDYRDAYSHVDPNLPNRNILGAPSSYLCSISSLQDYRNELHKQLNTSFNRTKTDYLKSSLEYGDYWYRNLTSYTEDTYEYVMRMASKSKNKHEAPHKFYVNDRNPRIFTPNLDLLDSFGAPYKPVYTRGLDAPYLLRYSLDSMYERPISILDSALTDSKSAHQVEKLKGLFKKSRKTILDDRLLDTLNASEVAVLKIREFRGYVKHNFSSYNANRTLSNLLDQSVEYSQELFRTIFAGLKSSSSRDIVVKGYEGMRNFIYKI